MAPETGEQHIDRGPAEALLFLHRATGATVKHRVLLLVNAAAVLVAGCDAASPGNSSPELDAAHSAPSDLSFSARGQGAVFTLTDADGSNEVLAFPRGHDGQLASAGVLYVQTDGQIESFRIGDDGSLAPLGAVSVAATARGVAAR